MSDQLESFAVIGGEGFVGGAIMRALEAKYPEHPIASFGLTQRTFTPGYRFFRTDITSKSSILESLKLSGATTIFHTASPQHDADKQACEDVNIRGTKALLEACVEARVTKLVFTSSITICYEGKDLINVDERIPVVSLKGDHYGLTKAEAERLVLEANGKDGLLTCSLRYPGIIGPGDRQAIPGFINVLKSGQTPFQVGHNRELYDFVHVANVAHSQLLAAERLTSPGPSHDSFSLRLPPVASTIPRRQPPTSVPSHVDAPLPASRNRYDQFSEPSEHPVAGQVFLITNGEPIGIWSLARAIWHEYNGHVPPFTVALPQSVGLTAAYGMEWFTWGIEKVTGKKVEAGITVERVKYVTTHMYFNIEKARRVLGYEPVISLADGIKDSVQWVKDEEAKTAAKNKAS
ncbi:C-3 sterol dehydrogenase (C-4 sterol decarboxylase) [Pseudohyphozyma bogoriensis]|nr:C-3 sterol dehydrogenase (C-4 sterol decarboxylase) [Pseudohyphozyma bogoriensis]